LANTHSFCSSKAEQFCTCGVLQDDGFDCQIMSTLMLERHHTAPFDLVQNQRFYTWEKRWQESAEQFSCLVINRGVSASIGNVTSARGACRRITGSWVAFVLLPTELMLKLAWLCSCCKQDSGGGVFTLMIMHVCGDKLVELACVSRDDSDQQDDGLVCKVEDLSGIVRGWLEDSIYLEYHNFITSRI
jgi:hypothetical protein